MEGTGEQEENSLDGNISGSHEKLQESACKGQSKSDKFKVELDGTDIDDAITSRPASERSKTDVNLDTTHPSGHRTEIGCERLRMRNCPFFYIPDNRLQKKLTQVHSKIGSLENINHSAGGGDKKIFSQKVDFSTVTSRINSKGNTYPIALPVKDIRTSSLRANRSSKQEDIKPVPWGCSKIGSLKNINHVPGGGDKKIPTYRTPDYKHKVSSKLDTTDPTPSVHNPKNDIHELMCDEVIHYHSRYKHSGRPHSAPTKRSSQERSLHSSGSDNSTQHLSLDSGEKLHTENHATESSSESTRGDK